MSFEVIAIAFAILVWFISNVVKGLKWLAKQLGGTNAPPSLVQQAAAEAQRQAAAGRPPGLVAPAGYQPMRPPAPLPPPLPAPVRYKTSAAAFVSQEEALLAEEAAGLGIPLVSPATPRAPQAGPLFGKTDDLVRAIILQVALGPPLSQRSLSAPPASAPPTLPPT